MISKLLKKELQSISTQPSYAKHTGIIFGAQVVVLLFGVLIKIEQTRLLSVEEYGTYAFFGSLISFLLVFYRFGFYSSIKVLLANTSDNERVRELIGTGMLFAFAIGISFSISLFWFSFFVDQLFNVSIGRIILILSPLCFTLPYKMFISEISVGANKIQAGAVFEVLNTVLFLVIITLFFFSGKITLLELILYNLISVLVATLVTLKLLNPSFKNSKLRSKEIFKKNREYGWHYYIGAVSNQSTFKLDELFITFFVNVTQLGFYSLANMICSPMSILSAAMGKSMYKKMASLDKIPKKLFLYNSIWLMCSGIGLYFTAEFIISFLFGDAYSDVALFVLPLSVAHFFQGLSSPYTFLSAKSQGKEIRNVAFAEAIINLVGNIILVPLYGVYGAIFASIIARMAHYFYLTYYYRAYINTQNGR